MSHIFLFPLQLHFETFVTSISTYVRHSCSQYFAVTALL